MNNSIDSYRKVYKDAQLKNKEDKEFSDQLDLNINKLDETNAQALYKHLLMTRRLDNFLYEFYQTEGVDLNFFKPFDSHKESVGFCLTHPTTLSLLIYGYNKLYFKDMDWYVVQMFFRGYANSCYSLYLYKPRSEFLHGIDDITGNPRPNKFQIDGTMYINNTSYKNADRYRYNFSEVDI